MVDPSSPVEKGIPFSCLLIFLRAGVGGGIAEGAEEENGTLLCMSFVEEELGSIFLFHGPWLPPAMPQQHPDFCSKNDKATQPQAAWEMTMVCAGFILSCPLSLHGVPGDTFLVWPQ